MVVTPEQLARTLLERNRRRLADDEAARLAVRAKLPDVVALLRAEHGATELWLFGSVAWGGFTPASDVDLAVRGIPPVDRSGAAVAAEAKLRRPIELFDLDKLPSEFAARILEEGERLL